MSWTRGAEPLLFPKSDDKQRIAPVQDNILPSSVSQESCWRGWDNWTHDILQTGRWDQHSPCPPASPSMEKDTIWHAGPPSLFGNAEQSELWEEDFGHWKERRRPVPVTDLPEWFCSWHGTRSQHPWMSRNWEGELFDQRATSVGTEWRGSTACG